MNDSVKPGWRTTEFWCYLLAMLIDYAIADGFTAGDESWVVKLLVMAAATLAAIGYGQQRSAVKKAASNNGR